MIAPVHPEHRVRDIHGHRHLERWRADAECESALRRLPLVDAADPARSATPTVPAEITSAYLASVPAGRIGTSEDIAHAVSFFASEAAGFITGRRVVVDGGRGLDD
jgi:NAD(P)-dependent dehydrogenase (short-subunit alcohol dehydrogenase family)